MLTYGAASYTYTANGELASKSVGSQMTTYQYDVLGNLLAVALPDGRAISFVVDAQNRRVGRIVNGDLVTGFLYDGDRIVAVLDAGGAIVTQFVYGTRSNTPDYMVQGGVTYRIFSDQLGSPRLVVNSSTGQVAERIDYDEFGNVVNDTNPGFQPFGFAGGLYDQDTKLVRFGARDYDPTIGRWTAKDPTWFNSGDTNLYGYVGNDPINFADLKGLQEDAGVPSVVRQKFVNHCFSVRDVGFQNAFCLV
jgi:RHS repeat-associated protein